MPANVDGEKCTVCGQCAKVCPLEAIRIENELAVVYADECTDCGLCVDECPSDAISLAN